MDQMTTGTAGFRVWRVLTALLLVGASMVAVVAIVMSDDDTSRTVGPTDADPSMTAPSQASASTNSVTKQTTDQQIPLEEPSRDLSGGDPGAESPLLFVTGRKDGDSWVASDGIEYRLGLVNAPERGEPCGSAATDFTYPFLADGIRAEAYTTDRYGRSVAEVFSATGESLNVALAASGLGNDRYLAQFRHENPDLAQRLDAAFADAPVPACAGGMSSALSTEPPPTTTVPRQSSSCHPGYASCIPIKGEGSGDGEANDLDCGEIGHRVQLPAGSTDPYRLDADGDGWGCDSYS